MRAAPLTLQVPAERDKFGRLLVDRDLRVLSVPGVFATGDAGMRGQVMISATTG